MIDPRWKKKNGRGIISARIDNEKPMFFDAIYVINLATRSDRRVQMCAQFRKVGIDPEASPVVFFDAIRPADAGGFPTLGTRGCFLSHLGVMRDAQARGHERILVLEDDLNFSDDFVDRFDRLAQALDQMGWDIWYLSTLAVTPAPIASNELVVVPVDSSVLGAHMFAVNSRVVAGLIPYLEAILARPPGDPAGGPMHVDGAYGWYRRAHPEVRTVMASKALGYQRPSRTDIHALRWFDRVPVVKGVAGLLRGVRARLTG